MSICNMLVRLETVRHPFSIERIWSPRVIGWWVPFHLPTAGVFGRVLNWGNIVDHFRRLSRPCSIEIVKTVHSNSVIMAMGIWALRQNRQTVTGSNLGIGPIIQRSTWSMNAHLKKSPKKKQCPITRRTMKTSIFVVNMTSSRGRSFYIFHKFIAG